MLTSDSPAVARARAHVEAWSSHDWEAARSALAADVQVTAVTTNPAFPDTNLTGVDAYMQGLIAFAQPIVPGSQHLLACLGDERNALLMLTVQLAGPDGTQMTLAGARSYLFDDDGKIKVEQVVFYTVPA
ncbi:MAG: nuclear transport factor 2 family protein [Candidatus Dormibacteraeota bacterium]|nr:nuclear transport factor 2 family protein [Candidatus Dormibacteraeota bacterium]